VGQAVGKTGICVIKRSVVRRYDDLD
jgi:hypothetical protein